MKNILILFGGNSYEHEISCKSVNFVLKNIDNNLFNYEVVGIDNNNEWFIVNKDNIIDFNWKKQIVKKVENIIEYCKSFDKIFSVIHGNTCEDGKLQSLFELNNIKYVGSDAYSSLICYDKLLTKLVLGDSILQIPYIKYNELNDLKDIEYPVIVKPSKSGSSIGINVAYTQDELNECINIAKKYDDSIIIEKYIKNRRELECAILEIDKSYIVSDVGEIVCDSWYDFDSKYKNKTKTCISDINSNLKDLIRINSLKIFKELNCKDLARVDFLYDLDSETLYFNEINTIPGFTNISMYPMLLRYSGINYKELITLLLK